MLRTNTSKFKSNMRKYLLEIIDYEECENLEPIEKFNYTYERFKSEAVYDYNIKRFKGNYNLIMADWLQGLPLGIDYLNYKILEVAKKLHDMKKKENFTIDQEEMIIDQWWTFIANHLMRECKEAKYLSTSINYEK
tara:strand:+ start:335 stop:742 length:408 start_codon:yes stop_codon:yes gene_type:complete